MIETIGLEKRINQKVILRSVNKLFPKKKILLWSSKGKKYILYDGKSMKKVKMIPKDFSGFMIEIFYNKHEFKTSVQFYRTPYELTSERELIIAYKLSEEFNCKTIINSGNEKISNNPYLSLIISEGKFFEADNLNSAWGGDGSEPVKIIEQIELKMYDFDSVENILISTDNSNITKDSISGSSKERKKEIIWNARKFLELILYFTSIEPDRNKWAPHKLYYHRKKVRLIRIISLLEAFGIENDDGEYNFIDFIDGEAFNYYELKDYKIIIQKIEEYSVRIKEEIYPSDIQDFFYHLLSYRISVERTLRLYDFPVEASFKGHIAGIRLIEEMTRKIREDNKQIDDMLILMLDPHNKEFTEYELIMNYNFPEDDLNKIDEEFWDNY